MAARAARTRQLSEHDNLATTLWIMWQPCGMGGVTSKSPESWNHSRSEAVWPKKKYIY